MVWALIGLGILFCKTQTTIYRAQQPVCNPFPMTGAPQVKSASLFDQPHFMENTYLDNILWYTTQNRQQFNGRKRKKRTEKKKGNISG